MFEIAFRVPAKFVQRRRAERIIEEIAKEHGLVLGMKGELTGFPGSIHWHYKKKDVSGTLEPTLWPAEKKNVGAGAGRQKSGLDF